METAGSSLSAPQFENDAVLGLRRRIPTLADCGVRLVEEPGEVRLMPRRPSILGGILAAGLCCGVVIGSGLLIHRLVPGGAEWAIWGTSAFAAAFVLIMTGVAIHRWRRSQRPLLIVRLVSNDVTVPTCGRTINRHQIRRVTRWVDRNSLSTMKGKNSLGWVRLTVQVIGRESSPRELVVATELFVPLQKVTLTAELANALARHLGVPVDEIVESGS